MIPSRNPPRTAGEEESQDGYKARQHPVTTRQLLLLTYHLFLWIPSIKLQVREWRIWKHTFSVCVGLLNRIMQQKQHLLPPDVQGNSQHWWDNWPVWLSMAVLHKCRWRQSSWLSSQDKRTISNDCTRNINTFTKGGLILQGWQKNKCKVKLQTQGAIKTRCNTNSSTMSKHYWSPKILQFFRDKPHEILSISYNDIIAQFLLCRRALFLPLV